MEITATVFMCITHKKLLGSKNLIRYIYCCKQPSLACVVLGHLLLVFEVGAVGVLTTGFGVQPALFI